MLSSLRKKIATFAAGFLLVAVPVAVPAVAFAASNNTIQNCLAQGSNLDISGGSACTNTNTDTGTSQVQNIIKDVINIFSAIVGIVSVIMIIYGGFKYITSGGDSNNITSAKNTIIYAVIGLVFVAMAQFIVQFVLNKVTNAA